MSDNDEYKQWDDINDDASLYGVDDVVDTTTKKKRVLLTTGQEQDNLEELLRIQNWATISKGSLLAGDLSHLEESGNFLLWKRIRGKTSMKIDMLNLYAVSVSLSVNGWAFEQIAVLSVCLASTLAYSLAPTPQDSHLASQLDFHYLATSLVYLVSFGAQQTLGRRDAALRYMCGIRAICCQMTLGLLLWNRDRPRPSSDFSDRVVECFQGTCYQCFQLLKIPTWNRTRHYFTKEGMAFRHAMRRRLQHRRSEFTKFMYQIHELLEECKETNCIETHETNRLGDFAKSLHILVEQIQLVKEYRTTNIARSFVRVFLVMCPAMYGVYFSYVAGNIEQSPGQAGLAYSVLLMFASIVLLLLLVNQERAMEDPCTTEYRGDHINIDEEMLDACQRMEMIRKFCSHEGRFMMHQYLDQDEDEDDLVDVNTNREGAIYPADDEVDEEEEEDFRNSYPRVKKEVA